MNEICFLSEDDKTYVNRTWSGNRSARLIHADGKPFHTFRTPTVLVEGSHLNFQHCVFENTAGTAEDVGQAIALYLDGDDIRLSDCLIKGEQDTLFLAPLPEQELEKDGFLGPKEYTPRFDRTVRFERCRIEGSVDFVFGGATAYFEGCEFYSTAPGWVFAPSTPAHVSQGFIVRNCRFTAAPGVPEESCYLARPWRNYGMVSLEHCYLGAHIHPQGFDDWNKKEAHETMRFLETDSYGPGASYAHRPDYVQVR